jgi:hypothetical protein
MFDAIDHPRALPTETLADRAELAVFRIPGIRDVDLPNAVHTFARPQSVAIDPQQFAQLGRVSTIRFAA